jgi:hypothetical protein
MTACLPLQDCIVQTTSLPAYAGNFSRLARVQKTATGLRPDNSAVALHAYLRRYMGRLQWQVLKLHECARRRAALLQWQFLKLHISALQWQDTKLLTRGGCCPAAVAGYQTACAYGCHAAVAGSQPAS